MNKNVLLIEDNLELQNLISSFLKSYDYDCVVFSKPLEVLKDFEENHHLYSIVILDLGLPGMDGFDLFKKFCSNKLLQNEKWQNFDRRTIFYCKTKCFKKWKG